MKIKTKALSIALAAITCFGMVGFVGCSNTSAAATSSMTVDINPSVEFTLDKNNKILTATALNDDGAVLISGTAFAGKTADEGAKLVVELATEQGYLVKGEIEGSKDEIKIAVSGDTEQAKAIYDKAKTKVEQFVNDSGLTAAVADFKARTDAELKAIAVAMGLDEAEAAKMTNEEIMKYIGEVRKETAALASEELRQMYYKAKNAEVKLSENEAVIAAIGKVDGLTAALVTNLQKAQESLKNAEAQMLKLYEEAFVKEGCAYRTALKTLLDKKGEFNKAKVELSKAKEELEAITDPTAKKAAQAVLDAKKAAYDVAEKGLEAAEKALATAKTLAESAVESGSKAFATASDGIDTLMKAITEASVKDKLEKAAKNIDKAVNTAKNEAFENFEKNYKAQIEAYNQMVAQAKANYEANAKAA